MRCHNGEDSPKGPPAIIVAGCHSGVGKTSVAVGLMVALQKKGLRVQPFKVGPDFLDPMHHVVACGRPSFNLDGWMADRRGCEECFLRACRESSADIAVIEGVMGLHDGLDGKSDAGSTAEMAKWLGVPVLLVVDAWCLSRSAAAMVLGYVTFDAEVPICGVIFNRVAGMSHATWLREAMQNAPVVASVPVLGCVLKDQRAEISERHLGLHMPQEQAAHIEALGALVSAHVDINGLCQLACSSVVSRAGDISSTSLLPSLPKVRIGVARDLSFCFYYEENLLLLKAAGATLVPFSLLSDTQIPTDLQAIYLGGGYPELHALQLEANTLMRASVKEFCLSGGLCYAECGGLMYLSQTLSVRPEDNSEAVAGRRFDMAGVLPFDVDMSKRMVMGYCTARPSAEMNLLLQLPAGMELRCQQYHFSEISLNGEPAERVDENGHGCGISGIDHPAYSVRMERPGALFAPEGIVQKSTLASYCHVLFSATPGFAEAVVEAARRKLTCASLLPSGTETFCAITGGTDRLVAVSTYCDYPEEVLSLRKVTKSLVSTGNASCEEVEAEVQKLLAEGITDFHPIDVKFLQSERPGIIFSQDACPTCSTETSIAGRALLDAGLEQERNLCIQTLVVNEILNSLELVGAAIGVLQIARSIKHQWEQRLDDVAFAIVGRKRPRVLGLECVCPLVASGQWLPDMRIRAGAVDALGDGPGAAPRRLSWEEVVASNPDVIVILCCGRDAIEAATETAAHLSTQPGFPDLPALKARPPQLFFVGHELYSRPGPRIIEGIEQLAALMHPDCFPSACAGDALQLQISESEELPSQANFVARCVPVFTGSKTMSNSFSCRSNWLFMKTPCQPSQNILSLAIYSATCEDYVLCLGGKLTRDVWRATLASDGILSLREQVCEIIVGESVPTARVGFSAVVWDDILLIFGGEALDTGLPIARLELLHLVTHCWTHGSTTGTPPSARIGLTMVLEARHTRIVFFGGWSGSHHLSDLHILDLQKWCWKRADILGGPSSRSDHIACACQEGMLIHGGRSEIGELGDLWLLHWQGPIEEWWWECLDEDPSSRGPRCKHAASFIGDNLIVAGGRRGDAPLLDVHMFSMRSKCWYSLPNLPYEIACPQSLVPVGDSIAIATQRSYKWALHYLPSYFLGCSSPRKTTTVKVASEKRVKADCFSWNASQPLSLQDVRDKAFAGDDKASKALASIEKLAEEKRPQACWAMLHRMANMSGCEQYVDPATGYMVFTATFLRKRPCCGNGCRHCPYGHVNVPKAGLETVAQDW